jgi:glycine oxidase
VDQGPRNSSYDVVVIGAGVIGLSCAWRAAEAGLSVVVVDRGGPGAGASGVAAGMLAPVTEASFGEEELLRLNLESAARWPAFDEELQERSGRPAGYERRGALVVAVDRDDTEELRRLHRFQRSLGLEVDWLTRGELRRVEPGLAPGIAGGMQAPQDHQAEPRALIAALTAAVEGAGGELASGVEVTAVERSGGRVTGVAARERRITASHVVVAAGPWSGAIEGLDAAPHPQIRPVKGQILRLRGGEAPIAGQAVHTLRCYVVPRASGEVVVGATVEERGFDTRVTAGGVHRLLESAWEVLPDVGELELVEASARLRPGTPDNLPVVGAGALDGLVWATGHHRNGILLAPLTAHAVMETIADGRAAPLGDRVAPARFAEMPPHGRSNAAEPVGSPA